MPALAAAPVQAVFSKGFAAAAEPAVAPSLAHGTVTQVPARSIFTKPGIPLRRKPQSVAVVYRGNLIAPTCTTLMDARSAWHDVVKPRQAEPMQL